MPLPIISDVQRSVGRSILFVVDDVLHRFDVLNDEIQTIKQRPSKQSKDFKKVLCNQNLR